MLRSLRAREWAHVRKAGRTHFIWRNRVLGWWVPIAAALSIYDWFDPSESGSRQSLPRWLAFTALLFVLAVVIGYIEAVVEWRRRDADFRPME